MKKTPLIFMMLFLPSLAFADSQCGPFYLGTSTADDGWARINGAKPETQKVTFLKAKEDYNNIKMQWMLATDIPGKWYGMDYVKQSGKAILNVQIVQANKDAPQLYGTFDCKKIN